MSTNLELSSTSPPRLPEAWIERLFERISSYYGARFADSWRGIDPSAMKLCWAEELAGYSGDEIAAGLRALKSRDWPPTLPEFLRLCRPSIDPRTAWVEACEQMPIRLQGHGGDRWSRPQVYWAAVAIGAHDLRALAWGQIRVRWERALANAAADPVPDYALALPTPAATSISREEARARSALLAQGVAGVQSRSADKAWAVALMRSEAGGDSLPLVAAKTWREVLGFDAGTCAAEAVAAFDARVAA